MSFNVDDDDDEDHRPVTRLTESFALRDLIAGAEFEIRDDEYSEINAEEHFNIDKYSPAEVQDYINLSALDIDADDSNNVISFSELRKKMTNVTDNGKIMKLIKRHGIGNIVNPDSVVYIHYNALVNLQEYPFDNSYLRCKYPVRYQLGKGTLLPGLELSLRTMRKGELSQFLIEPEYAFGKYGCPPRIPPDATLLYEVELFKFTDSADPENNQDLEKEDKESFPYALKLAKKNHVLGNDCFKLNNAKAAIAKYRKAVDILLSCRLKDDEEEAGQKKMLLKLYTNLCVCYNKVRHPQRVCDMAKEAFYVDEPNAKFNSKLLYNWGVALSILGSYKKAAECLRSALKLEPNNPSIKNELTKLERKKLRYAEQERITFQKALGYGPIKKEEIPVNKNDLNLVNKELVELVKSRIEEAKSGKTVRLNPPPEVLSRIEELCNDLAVKEFLSVERDQGAIVISKVKN
ncbi:inactive peptidyl-prolyl cis-trans isomerase shutdown [Lycorma delicatula]|uniref:inactive peptidyl-prolyl cis-trans isomerase shutdown n=1 Tax=Lycorma delicatula TaxID=130591 RepID=UPI003F51959F